MSYIEVFAEDKSVIAYRPKLARATGSILSAILLQQILHYWRLNNRQPFYKFTKPCLHSEYREGDSWIERMECSVEELRTGMKPIGTKITKGLSKTAVYDVRLSEFDARGRCLNGAALVLYWTDGDRVTWYDMNAPLFEDMVMMCYGGEWQNRIKEPEAKSGNSTFLDKPGMPVYLGKPEIPVYPINGQSPRTFLGEPMAPLSERSTERRTEKMNGLAVHSGGAGESSSIAASGSLSLWLPQAVQAREPISPHGLIYDAVCLWCQLDPRPKVLTCTVHRRVLSTVKYVTEELKALPPEAQTALILAAMERWYAVMYNGQRRTAPTPEQIKNNWLKLTIELAAPADDAQQRISREVKDERTQRRDAFDEFIEAR